MLKIYLKGFEMPYAVFGRKVFEDERFFVIEADGIQSRIPWKNILYIESIASTQTEQPEESRPVASQAPVQIAASESDGQVFLSKQMQEAVARAQQNNFVEAQAAGDKELNVVFTGFRQRSFNLRVPSTVPTHEYSAQLSKEIFSNPQVKAFMGDFALSGKPRVEGNNVFLETAALTEKVGALKDKLEMTQNFLTKLAGPMGGRPAGASLNLDSTFAMSGSPFNQTVSLQDD